MCNTKKSKFLKEQEARGLLSNLLGITLSILSDIPIVNKIFKKYKMNAIINKILLAGNKFMPELHLRQPRFTYSACGPFTKNKERIKFFKEIGDSRYIYQNELDIYNAKLKHIEDKKPDITKLATKTNFNAKINEVKGEIPNLAKTTALTTAENIICNVSNLVKKNSL